MTIPSNRTWILRSERAEIPRIVSELKDFLPGTVPETTRRKVLTVAEELLANALEHGSFGLGRSRKEQLQAEEMLEGSLAAAERVHGAKPISLDLSITGTELVLRVTDSGPGFEVGELSAPPGGEQLGGRGLILASGLADSLQTEKDKARITARFALS